jgi:hypothetical protein
MLIVKTDENRHAMGRHARAISVRPRYRSSKSEKRDACSRCTWCFIGPLDLQDQVTQLNNLTETARRGCKDVTLAISRVYLDSITMARQYTIKKKSEHASPLFFACPSRQVKQSSHPQNNQTAFPNIACSFIHAAYVLSPSRTSSRRRSQWPPSRPR